MEKTKSNEDYGFFKHRTEIIDFFRKNGGYLYLKSCSPFTLFGRQENLSVYDGEVGIISDVTHDCLEVNIRAIDENGNFRDGPIFLYWKTIEDGIDHSTYPPRKLFDIIKADSLGPAENEKLKQDLPFTQQSTLATKRGNKASIDKIVASPYFIRPSYQKCKKYN